MYIIEVLPIHKSKIKEPLSYFSSKEIKRGALVSIPFRLKKILGIVTESKSLIEQKSEIKKLSYNLKKIEKIKDEDFFDEKFLRSIKDIGNYYGTSESLVLKDILPERFLEGQIFKLNQSLEREQMFQVLTVQDIKNERFAIYKSYIREEFAKKNSVFFCVSSFALCLEVKEILEKGIETRTFVFTSEMSQKEIEQNISKLKEEGPKLVISTPNFFTVLSPIINTCIVDGHNSKNFISLRQPFLDYRKVIEVFSKNFNIKLILGDILLKIETIYSVKNDYFGELSPLKFRYITGTNCQIDFFGKQTSSKKIEIFTEKSKNILNETLHKNKHIFVYTTRKGLALNIFCADCGKNVVCNNCGAPVSLYENKKDKEDNFFMCNRCRTKRSALEKCQKCNSWKLIPFGFGTEAVLNEIKSITETPVYVIEKDSVKTVKKALQIVGDFYKSPKAILLGTNMAIPYLNKPVDNSIVTSLDGLLTMPDFRINEKIMKDVLNIREITEENLLVQTRQSEFKILEYATRANIADFYKEEIKEREEFEYPPFSIFIKISLLGSKNIIRKEMEKLKEELSNYDMFIFDGNYLTPKKEHIVSGLIKVKKEKWPDENLTKKLKQLPPQYIIKIDPDNIL